MAFHTDQKASIRELDRSFIAELSRKGDRKLSYLGLPSPEMQDIVVWREHLSKIFAVEQDKRYITHLLSKSFSLQLLDDTIYFWGDIDNIVKNGIDNYGRAINTVFPVDIVNLDYCDSLDKEQFAKLDTIKTILDLQQKAILSKESLGTFPYFLMFVTYNLPKNEGNPAAKTSYLDYLESRTKHFKENLKRQIAKAIQWYKSDDCPSSYLHKCFVLGTVTEHSSSIGFRAKPKSVIQYFGDHDALMLHYQLEFRISGNLGNPVPPSNVMSPIDVMNFRVTDVDGNDISSTRPFINPRTE